ncbi:MAG: response regulator, partial [Pseudomonadota bacterium]
LTDERVFAGLKAALTDVVETPADDHEDRATGDVITLAAPIVSGRVLVVEDNAANQQLIAAVLADVDVEMDLARNGVEAVAAASASEHAYDMILMDVNMPTMNGIEATRRIRRIDGANAETPIVALTAQAMPGDREKMLAAGMDDYLPKPLEIAPLRAKIQSVLERRPRKANNNGESAQIVAFDA